eukprot:1404457-Rhodomonas_salina.1
MSAYSVCSFTLQCVCVDLPHEGEVIALTLQHNSRCCRRLAACASTYTSCVRQLTARVCQLTTGRGSHRRDFGADSAPLLHPPSLPGAPPLPTPAP